MSQLQKKLKQSNYKGPEHEYVLHTTSPCAGWTELMWKIEYEPDSITFEDFKNVNAKNERGITALMMASYSANNVICKGLLDAWRGYPCNR